MRMNLNTFSLKIDPNPFSKSYAIHFYQNWIVKFYKKETFLIKKKSTFYGSWKLELLKNELLFSFLTTEVSSRYITQPRSATAKWSSFWSSTRPTWTHWTTGTGRHFTSRVSRANLTWSCVCCAMEPTWASRISMARQPSRLTRLIRTFSSFWLASTAKARSSRLRALAMRKSYSNCSPLWMSIAMQVMAER